MFKDLTKDKQELAIQRHKLKSSLIKMKGQDQYVEKLLAYMEYVRNNKTVESQLDAIEKWLLHGIDRRAEKRAELNYALDTMSRVNPSGHFI